MRLFRLFDSVFYLVDLFYFFVVFYPVFLSIFIYYLIYIYVPISEGSVVVVSFSNWLNLASFSVDWSFLFDSLSVIMLLMVLFVSTCVQVYSMSYMGNDPLLRRFVLFLFLFTIGMLILTLSNNFFVLFLGWEGIGLCSYLLINFWFTRLQAGKAAVKAMLMNRFGDIALIMAMLLLVDNFRSLSFSTLFFLSDFFSETYVIFCGLSFNLIEFVSFFIFLGAVGKSAQIGLHTWLPDAMEGPTPVSALIHAATMVTAGVFVIIRTNSFFIQSSFILNMVLFIGGLTAFFAATIGLVQMDIKKVIAYSTCSQLGYMVFACGLGYFSLGFYHLFTHAFFKALLFLSAGLVLHAVGDNQDMRLMGGLARLLPLGLFCILVGSLALLGFPALSGFFSKDVILEISSTIFTFEGLFVNSVGLLAAIMTILYSMRLAFLVFFSEPRSYRSIYNVTADGDTYIIIALIFLLIPSVFIGFFLKDTQLGLFNVLWNSSIEVTLQAYVDAEFLPVHIKLLPFLFIFLFVLAFTLFYNYIYNFNLIFFLSYKWFIDYIYIYIIKYFADLGFFVLFLRGEKVVSELFGYYGFRNFINKFSIFFLSVINTGVMMQKLFLFLFGLGAFLGIFVLFNMEEIVLLLINILLIFLLGLFVGRENPNNLQDGIVQKKNGTFRKKDNKYKYLYESKLEIKLKMNIFFKLKELFQKIKIKIKTFFIKKLNIDERIIDFRQFLQRRRSNSVLKIFKNKFKDFVLLIKKIMYALLRRILLYILKKYLKVKRMIRKNNEAILSKQRLVESDLTPGLLIIITASIVWFAIQLGTGGINMELTHTYPERLPELHRSLQTAEIVYALEKLKDPKLLQDLIDFIILTDDPKFNSFLDNPRGLVDPLVKDSLVDLLRNPEILQLIRNPGFRQIIVTDGFLNFISDPNFSKFLNDPTFVIERVQDYNQLEVQHHITNPDETKYSVRPKSSITMVDDIQEKNEDFLKKKDDTK